MDIPDELLFYILELAVEEHDYEDDSPWREAAFSCHRWTVLESNGAGGSLADEKNTAWLSSNRDLHRMQLTRSMEIKLATSLTCKRWLALTTELMYRTILVRRKSTLEALLNTLDEESERGRWTKGIFLYLDVPWGKNFDEKNMDQLLMRLVVHCPNLIALVWEPITNLFHNFADLLASSSSILNLPALRYISCYTPFGINTTTIAILSKMPSIVALRIEHALLHLEFVSATAKPLALCFPSLKALYLGGVSKPALAHISSWSMPKLEELSLHFDFYQIEEDVEPILRACGARLVTLDVRAYHRLDIIVVLALCPNLITFSCDIGHDWLHDEEVLPPLPLHRKLSRIGFYSDLDLGSFISAATNVISKLDRAHFPHLSSLRLLATYHLTHYLREGGWDAMDTSKSVEWIKIRRRCAAEGIRLEDVTVVTGHEFGTLLPCNDVERSFIYLDN
ncbi:hypothetical protein SCHPADRAFT_937291 [Schizopora paradoxa]|uniref:F-box domain-containing protein n=1 Tax=Schizopora paradoxa TaxID=27342 RepID=A0A0H2RZQ2_9AGAM|nr:hypothetical protein SCHPADRAFT_937291 [Schizopora paradoxa]